MNLLDAHDADRPALVHADGTRWTRKELAVRVAERSDALRREHGPQPRNHAFVAEKNADTILEILAAWKPGWTVVPLHPRWTEAERARYLGRLDGATVESEVAALVATSGSTDEPKAVALSHGAFEAAARASAERLGWAPSSSAPDRWLLSLSPAHVGGLSIIYRCLRDGHAVVLPTEGERFDARSFLRHVEERGVTLLSLVPTMLRRLLEIPGDAPESLRLVLVGGGPAPASLLARAGSRGWPVRATYGLTEACSQVATQRGMDDAGCGPLLAGLEGRIGEDGVLELRGPMLASGYVPGPRREPGDWLRTGDLARFGDDGCLHVLGRADDVIVTGGENVHPAEVEAALLAHPRVAAACVVGLEDEEWGRQVAAAIVPEPGRAISQEELRAHLRGRLAGFKQPKRYLFVRELPVRSVGKVDRAAVVRLVGAEMPRE